MNRIFDMDNKFFLFMGRVADFAILNIICILCCLPIVTAGASITALYYVTLKMVRNEESYIVRSFFKSFKQNLRQSTVIHLIMLVTGILLYFDLSLVNRLGGSVSKVLFCVFFMFSIIYLLILLYIYPIMAKFENTIRNTFVNALLMAIRHLPYTILMLVISVIPVGILFIPAAEVMSALLLLFIIMGLAVIAYCHSFFFVKIFDQYIPQETEEPVSDELLPEEEQTPIV